LVPEGGNADTKVTLSLNNVPLIEALRYLTELTKLKYKIEPYAVSIVPITENTTDLVTKEYRVPPGFIPTNTAPSDGSSSVPGGSSIDVTETRIGARVSAQQYLQSLGVPAPAGSFAQYVPAGSKLIVRNTPDAIDVIDSLVDAAIGVQPTQVEIESKFLEITQNNLKELGFDWLLGPLSLGGGVYGAGGTQGFGTDANPTAPNPANFPFVAGSTPVGQNPVTGGLRSGSGLGPNAAVTANGIDALLGTAITGVAPGVFGLSGVFTNPQFQVVIRALNQKKGVDLMSAPKVTTKSGRKALVRVVREFPYPTEFNPPEVPAPSTGGTTTTSTAAGGVISVSGAVTPSTPTAFETRNVGVTLEVLPTIGPDGYTVDLDLSPEVVEFDGFINYGSPVIGPTFNTVTGVIGTFQITPNVINQPIFSTRKVTTGVSVWDGQTVALGGLIREDVQKVQDKVPLLGDIPLAGRLFRSNVDQKIKRNLIIFTTVRLMDAEGRPVRQDDENDEPVEPLGVPQNLPPPTFETAAPGK
jgi:general secretion pathway protein D